MGEGRKVGKEEEEEQQRPGGPAGARMSASAEERERCEGGMKITQFVSSLPPAVG